MRDYLNSDEMGLLATLESFDDVSEEEAVYSITAASSRDGQANAIAKAWTDKNAQPIFNYLLAIIPPMLNQGFGVKYKKTLAKPLIGTKKNYDKLLNAFEEKLIELKFPSASTISTNYAYNKYPFDAKKWVALATYISENYPRLNKAFGVEARAYMKKVFAVIKDMTKLDLDAVDYIQENAVHIPDGLYNLYLKSLDTEEQTPPKRRIEKANEVTKSFFKTATPSLKQQQALEKKSPEKFNEWRKTLDKIKRATKALLIEIFNKKKYTIIDVKVAKKILHDNNLPDEIDDNFVGKVGIGITPSAPWAFYTKQGKLLDCVVTHNVVMNKKYDPKDAKSYYCTHVSDRSLTGLPNKVYTVDARNQSSQRLHNAARTALQALEETRNQFSTDIKQILNLKEGQELKLENMNPICALICRVLDETSGRIGNHGSESKNPPTYGIHNLKMKHLTFTKGNTIIVKYIGKKEVPQEHIIRDSATVKAIKNLTKGRKKEQYVFSPTGETPVYDSTVRDYLKFIGFPGTPHTFRKIRADVIFNAKAFPPLQPIIPKIEKARNALEILQGKLDDAQSSQERKELRKKISEAKKKVKELEQKIADIFAKVNDEIAKALGHTEKGTSINSYIDPLLMKRFYEMSGLKIPKPIQRIIDKQGEQDPDSDD